MPRICKIEIDLWAQKEGDRYSACDECGTILRVSDIGEVALYSSNVCSSKDYIFDHKVGEVLFALITEALPIGDK